MLNSWCDAAIDGSQSVVAHAGSSAHVLIDTPMWAWSAIAKSDPLLYRIVRFASRLPIVIPGLSL